MKKLIWITTILLIALCAFMSCAQEPSDSEPADNMTDSYRNARQRVHDSSNIWLPKLEGVEIANIEVTDRPKPLVNISFAGDEALFNQLSTYLNETIGKEPDMSSETLNWWEFQYSDNNQVYVGNISINLYQGMISLASHFFRGFTVTISVNPAAGGTALIYPGGSNIGVSSLTEAENSDTVLEATPSDGYAFAGWYLGETLISDKATVWDYKIPSQNVTIDARFTQLTTTSYAEASVEFKTVTGLDLPAIADLEVDREYPYEEGDSGYCFDIIGGEALTYQSYLALETFLNDAIGDPDEGYPLGDEANGRGSKWTTATRWYTLDWYKLDNESFMIFLNTDAISE